jgi:chromosome segregation ATPase
MLKTLFSASTFLREEDPGHPDAGGDIKADDAKLTIGQRLTAALVSRSTLQATIADRDAQVAEHAATIERISAELAEARTALETANARITAMETEATEIGRALETAEAEAAELKAKEITVEKKAQEKVAQIGFSAASLPAAEEVDHASIDELRARVAQTTDPAEKQRLVAQIRAMRDAA